MNARAPRSLASLVSLLALLALPLRAGAEAPPPRATSEADASHARVIPAERAPWIDTPSAVVSIVARNWEGASRLAGGPLAPTDAIRASRSSRMLVARAGLAFGRIVPFAQIGVGQWRDPDPHLVLVAPTAFEYAAQGGAGVAVALATGASLAIEWDWTRMVLEPRQAEAIASHYLGWGEAFAVVRWNFEATASSVIGAIQ